MGPHREHRFRPGLRGSINKSAYVAAKHGVVGLTKVNRPRERRKRASTRNAGVSPLPC